jgi:hypothetical protein
MKTAELTLPEIALIAGTRGVLGAGLALLLANRINEDQRKAVGWAMFLIGALSTIPLAVNVLYKKSEWTEGIDPSILQKTSGLDNW